MVIGTRVANKSSARIYPTQQHTTTSLPDPERTVTNESPRTTMDVTARARFLGLLACCTVGLTTCEGEMKRPNVLIFFVDDMGYSDVGAFGSPNASTPNVDALVSRGMKMTQWISAAPICTPSRASLQTGRYPIRTGCIGNVEQYRVIPTPSSPGGLDPASHVSIAEALKRKGYRTGMSGKWHLGINGNGVLEQQDFRYHPNAHGYDTYLGAPYTNAPMCEMDADGVSSKHKSGPINCFMMANETVVQQPLRLENFTSTITSHALNFILDPSPDPFFFLMSFFHVHTPLFTNRSNRNRSLGGEFGDNVEEMDDSVGAILAALRDRGVENNTLIFFTSDNGPYQEEGWDKCGRTNVYDEEGTRLGRLKGGKGQVFEGGVRMPGAVVWPGHVRAGSESNVMVSTMDIFPTVLEVADAALDPGYVVDGQSMIPVITQASNASQHDVFFHYCGFHILAVRVSGRFKVFFGWQRWYTNDPFNASVCVECCNGANPLSKPVTGVVATELCGCEDKDVIWFSSSNDLDDPLPVYDMLLDPFERDPLTPTSHRWPANESYANVVRKATLAREEMMSRVHPTPNRHGAGTCTAGVPLSCRQPCCPGCRQDVPEVGECKESVFGKACECDSVPDYNK